MNNLGLPNPKMMEVAVLANLLVWLKDVALEIEERTLPANEVLNRLDARGASFINLRDQPERERIGVISGSIHVPCLTLRDRKKEEGFLSAFSSQTGQQPLLCCTYGERPALALKYLEKDDLRIYVIWGAVSTPGLTPRDRSNRLSGNQLSRLPEKRHTVVTVHRRDFTISLQMPDVGQRLPNGKEYLVGIG